MLALAGCSSSTEDPGHPLASVLLPSAPDGYETVDGASGPMDIETASTASAADPTSKRALLGRSGYQDGYSRVFRDEEKYIVALAHEFSSRRGAARLVDFEIKQISEKIGTALFTVKEIEGAEGYILSGVKRKGLTGVFCQGVWFPLGPRAFEVATCGPQPDSAAAARALAIEQHERASDR